MEIQVGTYFKISSIEYKIQINWEKKLKKKFKSVQKSWENIIKFIKTYLST